MIKLNGTVYKTPWQGDLRVSDRNHMSAEVIGLSPEVETMLVTAGLPVSDLSPSPNLILLGVHQQGQLLGAVGIEAYGTEGLLRSLVVAPDHRSAGLGLRLMSDAESWAAARGIRTLYLLTTTAAEFFEKRGYEAIARSEAPASITATAQFKDLCPASSTLMRKVLTANHSLQRTPAASDYPPAARSRSPSLPKAS